MFNSTSASQTFTLTNTGTETAAFASVSVGDEYYLTSTTCPQPIGTAPFPPGAVCTANVRFAPRAHYGNLTGSISATYSLPSGGNWLTASASLSGNSTFPPIPYLSASATAVNFGSQPIGSWGNPQTITITSNGNVPLVISSVAFAAPGYPDWALWSPDPNSCVGTIPVNGTCTISLYFLAYSPGNKSGTLQITSNSTGGLSNIALAGTGVAGTITTSASTLSFPTQSFGVGTATQTVTLTNTGVAPVGVSSITPTTVDYSIATNNCPATLAVGATCQVGVQFTPYATGDRSAQLTVQHNGTNSPSNVVVTGTGANGLVLNGVTVEDKTLGGAGGEAAENLVAAKIGGKECIRNGDETYACIPTVAMPGLEITTGRLGDFTNSFNPIYYGGWSGVSIYGQKRSRTPLAVCGDDGTDGDVKGSGEAGANRSSPPSEDLTPTKTREHSLPANDIGKNVPPQDPQFNADPVHAAIGAKQHQQVDYVASGGYPLIASRTYQSLAPQSSAYVRQFFGAGWYGAWDRSVNLEVGGTIARVTRGSGVSIIYTKLANGTWQGAAGDNMVLTKLTDGNGNLTGWKYARDKTFETYNANGRLTAVTLEGGQTYTLAYNTAPKPQLVTVTDPSNRILNFLYDTQGRVQGMYDPAFGYVAYTYDTLHRLIKVTYPDTRTRQYKYENATYKFALTSIINEAGVTYVIFTYDAQGRGTGNTFTGNVGVGTLAYNANGSSTASDASGATVTRSFQVIQGNVKTTGLQAACPTCGAGGTNGSVSQATTYDTNGMMASSTDAKGVVSNYTYNTRNLIASQTEASGTALQRVTSYTWHPTFSLPTQVVEPTRTTDLTYDTAGRILTQAVTASGQTRTTTTTYNAQGLVASVKGPRTDVNDTTSYTYDAKGNVATITNPKGQVTSYISYDMNGNVLAMTYPNGTQATMTYDARSRLLTQTVGGGTTTNTYDIRGLLITVTNPDGTSETSIYDAAHRLTGRDLSNGEKLRFTLDNAGRTTQTQTFDAQNILSSTASVVYDGLNRVTQRIDAQGKVTSYTYDANGNATAVTDSNGLTTTTAFDALNRPILVTDPLAKTVAYTYTPLDKIATVCDPNNATTTYSYNGFGDNTALQSPDTGTTTQTYNEGGLPIAKTDARGKTSTYTYDVLGRVIQVAYNDTTSGTTMNYDVAANGVGQLANVSDPSGTTSFTYDAYGRVLSKASTIGSGGATISRTVSYTRDNIGRITATTYPSGMVIGASYAQGRLSGMTLNGAALISGIQYFPLGGAESWLLGANQAGTKDYTRLIDQSSRIQKYSTPTGYRELLFDNASRITTVNNYLGTTNPVLQGTPQYFAYDNAGRLTGASGPISQPGTTQTQYQYFTYDNNGNRLTTNLNNVWSNYSYQAGNNRLASVTGAINQTNSFDLSGNLTSTGNQTYSYDGRGRLTTAIANGLTTSYLINYQQLRVKKANSQETKHFVYDDAGHMLGEYDQAGNPVMELVWLSDTPVAIKGTMPCLTSTSGTNGNPSCTESAIAYVWTDHLNTPRELTRVNASNQHASIWKWDSLPFGETDPNGNPSGLGTMTFNHRFPGQYRDQETELHQNWMRDYDPRTGRYIESDPLGLEGGLNRWRYANANPISYIDPTGLDPSDAISAMQLLDKIAKLAGKPKEAILAKLGCDKAESAAALLVGIASAAKEICRSPGRLGDRDAAIGACTVVYKSPPSAFGSYIDACVPIIVDIRANPDFTQLCKAL